MKDLKILLLSILLNLSPFVRGASVDTVEVFSNAMHKKVKVALIFPDGYTKDKKEYPTVYLLHGYSGNFASWVKDFPVTSELADQYNVVMVSPDGGYGSWYWDSPILADYQYETFIIKELVSFVDSHYNTIKERKGRGITGLSMGGQGAFYLAFKHQDVFGAAGSQSGGLDIRPFPLNWDMAKYLGNYAEFPERWEQNTVINLTPLLVPGKLAISFECGVDDFFIGVNRALHEKLLYLNIPHDYTERPGVHNWDYWNQSIVYQLLFFHNFFTKDIKK